MKTRKVIQLCNWITYLGKKKFTNPTFHKCASVLHFGLDLFDFSSIGVEGDFVSEEVYRTEKKIEKKKSYSTL
jgi:hypothetical protein